MASGHGLDIDQLDVRTAFLNGELAGRVYLKLPAELGGKTWLLCKALYGLKQAARQWHAKLREEMLSHGLTPSQHEPCLFFRGEGEECVFVMIHVQDSLVVGTTPAVRGAKDTAAVPKPAGAAGTPIQVVGLVAATCPGAHSG